MSIQFIEGGVTAAKGFKAASVAAGIKKSGKLDMALVYSETPCRSAGTFTTNRVQAAPVKWDRNQVYSGDPAQAIVINLSLIHIEMCIRDSLISM